MASLGRQGALAPLTSADIPAGIIEGTDVAFLENSSGQNLGGTYSTERMYLSGRTGSAPNDYNYKLTGNITVTGHLALGTIADEDVVITQDSTERTITGSGTLEAGNVLQDTHRTSLTDMTGELGSAVTGSPAITGFGTVTSGTLGSGVTFPTNVAQDYEEGTFTLAYGDSNGNSFTMQSTQKTGFYTKIGRVVTISGRFEATSTNSVTTSQIRMIGLPFPANSTSYTGMTAITMSHASGLGIDAGDNIDGFVEAGSNYIRLRIWDQTTGQRDVNEGHISADGAMVIGGTYTT